MEKKEMIKLRKYECPACNKKLFKAPKGFLNQPTACSPACCGKLRAEFEYQFTLWGFTDYEMKRFYWRVTQYLKLMDQEPEDLTYLNFIIWLGLKHGKSSIALSRVYNGFMEKNNARVEW